MTEIPLRPFPHGKISPEFGGPANSAKEVIERARLAISPRGAWSPSGRHKTHKDGTVGRCILQLIDDVDGQHATKAKSIITETIKEMYPKYDSIPSFNDSEKIHKHDVIQVLDQAIEKASK